MQATIIHHGLHVESHTQKSYVLYRIKFVEKERTWHANKRYSDFVRLHSDLKQKYKINTTLPPKIVLPGGKTKKLEERKDGLQIYMDYILTDTEISRDELVEEFINKPNSVDSCDVFDFLRAVPQDEEEFMGDDLQLNFTLLEQFMSLRIEQKINQAVLAEYKGSSDVKNRISVLREILNTEISYVGHTTLLWNMYYLPMIGDTDAYKVDDQDVPGLPVNIATSLFPPNLDTILTVHAAILTKMHQIFEPYLSREPDAMFCLSIGKLFQAVAPLFGVYVHFLQKYDQSVTEIRKYREKYPQFEQWLTRRKKHPDSGGFDILSCLITPVQRLPRYLMLLQNLIKYTPTDHSDYFSIERAIRMISDRISNHNDMVKLTVLKRRAQKIAKRLRFEYSPKRRLIKEGRATIQFQPHIVYLFNDVLILENEHRSTKKAPVFVLRPMNAVKIFLSGNTSPIVKVWWNDENVELSFENAKETVTWMHAMESVMEVMKGLSDDDLDVPQISSSCSLRYFLYASDDFL